MAEDAAEDATEDTTGEAAEEAADEQVEAPDPGPSFALVDGVCYATPREGLIEAVGPTAGRWPVWMASGSDGRIRDEAHDKVVWVVARDLQGELRVTARQLDGEGQPVFRRARRGERNAELTIPFAHLEAQVPGRAGKDVRERYAFHGGYVYFPGPGCYQFTATYGGEEVIIVVEMKARGGG